MDATEALPQLIAIERIAIAERNVALLSQLWLSDARIVDARGTEDHQDDYIWDGWPAILDRYRIAVFPNPPPLIEPPVGLLIEQEKVEGKEKSARWGTEQAVVKNGGDRWRFVRQDGRWWIVELTYSLAVTSQ
ncbi:hypothetical protein KFU94_53130 [Chloroflexi bacterium TSY]|nr:hypothetical protein [Chloroflexi bacterium TSY]